MSLNLNGISGVREAVNISPDSRFKIAIIGEPNAGKSWLSSSAPDPVFVFDADDRAESLHGIANVFVKTYTGDEAWSKLEADIAMFEYNKTQNKEIPATFVFDSMTYWAAKAMKYYFKYNNVGRKDIAMGSIKVSIARGYDAYAAEFELMTGALNRCFALGNVIAIFHERAEEAPESTEERPIFTGRVTVHPPRLRAFLSSFNDKWRVTVDQSGQRQVQVTADHKFLGGTTLFLSGSQPPDIKKMLEKHKAEMLKKKV